MNSGNTREDLMSLENREKAKKLQTSGYALHQIGVRMGINRASVIKLLELSNKR